MASSYGVEEYSQELLGYAGAYADELNDALSKLKVGQCTEVFESETGYYAVALLTDQDQDLLSSFAYSKAAKEVDDAYQQEKDKWLKKCDENGGAVLKNNIWETFSLVDMAKYLNEKGKMK